MWSPKFTLAVRLCASLLLIGPCISAARSGYTKAPGVLRVNLKTVFDVGRTTWIMNLHSPLLKSPTPALFLGAVPADTVATVCKMIQRGKRIIPAAISVLGRTESHSLKVISVMGCDASSSPPEGVQAHFTDRDGIENFVICHENITHDVGCALYRMGDDANAMYHEIEKHKSTTVHDLDGVNSSDHLAHSVNKRRLEDCKEAGTSIGTIIGVGTFAYYLAPTLLNCAAFGPFYPLCVASALTIILGVTVPVSVVIACAGEYIQHACFPGDGLVILSTGLQKPMMELSIGDQVAVMKPNGQITYDDIYAFGHKDPNAMSFFVKITLKRIHKANGSYSVKSLELSPRHFVPISLVTNGNMVYKRAKDIDLGDILQVHINDRNTLEQFIVIDLVVIVKVGLYNPFTLSGNVLVGDVVASVHSDWFLDDLFDMLKITHWLPMAYQIILSPARMLYQILGKNAYTRLYHFLDAHIDISMFGTFYGGKIVAATTAMLFGISLPTFTFLKRVQNLDALLGIN